MSTEPPFTNAIFTLFGALIGAFATYFAAKNTWQNLQFNEAATRFTEAFVTEVIALRRTDKDVYHVLTEVALDRHERATVLFEPYLSLSKRELLREAWKAYATSLKTAAPGSLNNRPVECENALAQIERLLSFARQK